MAADTASVGALLGLRPGLVVQELGWDSDVDESFRSEVMDAVDGDMVEETDDAVDLVVLWWRTEDGDVVDGLFDALRDLSDSGVLWLLTPKVQRPGHVPQAEIGVRLGSAERQPDGPVLAEAFAPGDPAEIEIKAEIESGAIERCVAAGLGHTDHETARIAAVHSEGFDIDVEARAVIEADG